jgi:SagB-type dehydrogenase family enzyme
MFWCGQKFFLLYLLLSSMSRSSSSSLSSILSYHLQTKHSFERYARASRNLDWQNQPNPFRRYSGSDFIPLQLIDANQWQYPSPKYSDLFTRSNLTNIPVNFQTISRFLELSLGITAWKQAGQSKWALRSNPSSGNLHPTEGFILLPSSHDFESGLYHYCPKDHGLEMRAKYDADSFQRLISPFPRSSFLMGLTSIHWREAWKYGERAYRYCNHDLGHAIASIRIAAATLGWNIMLLEEMNQTDLGLLFGTSRSNEFPENEKDHPESLLVVWPLAEVEERSLSNPLEGSLIPSTIPSQTLNQLFSGATWFGEANRLSTAHGDHWEIIDQVASDAWKSTESHVSCHHSSMNPQKTSPSKRNLMRGGDLSSVEIIRQRRSAVSFDPETSVISSESFFQLLSRIFPRKDLQDQGNDSAGD